MARIIAGLLLVAALGVALAADPTSQSTAKAFQPIEPQRLHNAHRLTAKVLSGAQPDDEAAFQALRDQGVVTIISVDGAKPDVALARQYGMRYVHLPIGYDGVSKEQGEAIAKALHELPGPIYIHCHHGRHRSAAAVAVACVYNGVLQPEQAESVLKTFGTGLNYKGLWQAAREARPLDAQVLANLSVEYVETAKIPALAEAMVQVDTHSDHLKLVQKAGWKQPPDHPDLDPPHEALQLLEHYKEIARLEDVQARPEDFRKWLTDGQSATEELQTILSNKPIASEKADAAFKHIAVSCTDCHKSYRD